MKAAFALLVVLTVAHFSVASAQPEDRTGPEAEAFALFELGNEHVNNEEIAEAVSAFSRSLDLVPRVSVALNLALALQSMGQPIEALQILRAIEAGEYGDAHQRLNIAGQIERISQLVGTAQVAVASTAQGDLGEFSISVDGVIAATLTRAGATSFPINPGSHVITATALDHEPARQLVDVSSGGRVELSLRMTQLRDTRAGILIVDSLPEAVIDVQGYGSAVGSLELELAPREYQVVVTGDEGSDESLVEVPPGRTVRLYLEPPTTTFWESPWLWTTVGIVLAAAAGITIWFVSQTERAPIESELEIFRNINVLRSPSL